MRVAYTLEQCWHRVPGGTARSMLRLAQAIEETGAVELVGVVGRHRNPPEADCVPTIDVQRLPVGRPLLYDAWDRLNWPKIESVTGPIDVCHSTAGIPAVCGAPQVVTIHDVAFLRRPDRLTRRGALVLTRAVERARLAEAVVCPSHYVRSDLIDAGFDERRVTVVPWGVDIVGVDDATAVEVIARHSLPDEFMLAVATLEPRKNLKRLVDAHARIPHPPALVVAGAPGWGGVAEELHDTASGVHFLGHVSASDLQALYSRAQLLAYPSEEEGFGLPVLEAMAAGTPVVTSRGTATEEAAGGAAVLVDPTDIDSIANGLEQALRDRENLVARGRTRAHERRWSTSGELMVDVYRSIVSRKR